MLNIDKMMKDMEWDGRKPACIQKILEDVTEKCAGSTIDTISLNYHEGSKESKEFKEFECLKYHHDKLFLEGFVFGDIGSVVEKFKGGRTVTIETITREYITPKGEVALKKLQSGDTNIW